MSVSTTLPFSPQHLAWMREALDEARSAAKLDEIPVGTLVIDANGSVVSRTHNLCRAEQKDVTGHAEMRAIREASLATPRGTLEGYTLVVTLEPCVMCAGAIMTSRIQTVVFGAWDEKAGAAGSVFDLLRDRRLPHQCEVVAGVLETESQLLLKAFFEQRRSALPGAPER